MNNAFDLVNKLEDENQSLKYKAESQKLVFERYQEERKKERWDDYQVEAYADMTKLFKKKKDSESWDVFYNMEMEESLKKSDNVLAEMFPQLKK